MSYQLFSRLQQKYDHPLHHHHHHHPPPPSPLPTTTTTTTPPPQLSAYLHICKHGAPRFFFCVFAPTKADPSRGGELPQSERSVRNGDQEEGGGEKEKETRRGRKTALILREHSPTECPPVTGERGENYKSIRRQLVGKKRTFCEAERVGSPSFLAPRNPTSTSPLAERNMQTHFIDFWSSAEKPKWTSATRARARSAQGDHGGFQGHIDDGRFSK